MGGEKGGEEGEERIGEREREGGARDKGIGLLRFVSSTASSSGLAISG